MSLEEQLKDLNEKLEMTQAIKSGSKFMIFCPIKNSISKSEKFIFIQYTLFGGDD